MLSQATSCPWSSPPPVSSPGTSRVSTSPTGCAFLGPRQLRASHLPKHLESWVSRDHLHKPLDSLFPCNIPRTTGPPPAPRNRCPGLTLRAGPKPKPVKSLCSSWEQPRDEIQEEEQFIQKPPGGGIPGTSLRGSPCSPGPASGRSTGLQVSQVGRPPGWNQGQGGACRLHTSGHAAAASSNEIPCHQPEGRVVGWRGHITPAPLDRAHLEGPGLGEGHQGGPRGGIRLHRPTCLAAPTPQPTPDSGATLFRDRPLCVCARRPVLVGATRFSRVDSVLGASGQQQQHTRARQARILLAASLQVLVPWREEALVPPWDCSVGRAARLPLDTPWEALRPSTCDLGPPDPGPGGTAERSCGGARPEWILLLAGLLDLVPSGEEGEEALGPP